MLPVEAILVMSSRAKGTLPLVRIGLASRETLTSWPLRFLADERHCVNSVSLNFTEEQK